MVRSLLRLYSRLDFAAAVLAAAVGLGCGDSKGTAVVVDAGGYPDAISIGQSDADPAVDATPAVDAESVVVSPGVPLSPGTPDCVIPAYIDSDPAPIGWATCTSATVCAPGTVTGGGAATPVVVTTLPELVTALAAVGPKVVFIKGTIAMNGAIAQTLSIPSNTTLIGCGAQSVPAENQGHLVGSVQIKGARNVVIRNLLLEGYNCTDRGPVTYLTGDLAGMPDCQQGLDAVSIANSSQNIWIDHVGVFDGSDGNLDVSNQANFVTVSWTKFYYSAARTDYTDKDTPDSGSFEATGHRFSNLVGGSDTAPDTGLLNVTWHHDWWGAFVLQRQPRVRFGKNHLFNNLYTSTDSSYAIGLGVGANLRVENNVFAAAMKKPINTGSYSDATSILVSTGNVPDIQNLSFPLGNSVAFTPPYAYTLEETAALQAAIQAGAGPQ